MSGKYDDILHLPHHVSTKHPQMSMRNRAAQFFPFAALTGYGEVIRETGRLTGDWMELVEGVRAELDRRPRLRAAYAQIARPGLFLLVFVGVVTGVGAAFCGTCWREIPPTSSSSTCTPAPPWRALWYAGCCGTTREKCLPCWRGREPWL